MSYVEDAEAAVKALKKNNRGDSFILTTSKIRGLLSLVSQVYNDARFAEKVLSDDIVSRIQYLRVRMVYEAGRDDGRDKPVNDFLDKTKLLKKLEEVGADREKFMEFHRYFEALVAYFKFHGGRD
ncbi:type III-A CRISPR-associated protein Csm2 [Synergistales bacterium]|nr:type III-A CRISPR-associated protein Csm2 [Synergistales bacterium]GHV53332.1 type III-A CRISPR-associated protein Csm2 [Synergistales bacterium]